MNINRLHIEDVFVHVDEEHGLVVKEQEDLLGQTMLFIDMNFFEVE